MEVTDKTKADVKVRWETVLFFAILALDDFITETATSYFNPLTEIGWLIGPAHSADGTR